MRFHSVAVAIQAIDSRYAAETFTPPPPHKKGNQTFVMCKIKFLMHKNIAFISKRLNVTKRVQKRWH